MAYTKYSLTPANNTAAPPDGAPEGMLPSAVNDTMRDMMAQIRDVGDGVRDGTYTMTAPKITGGTITGVTLTGNTLTNPVITGATLTTSAFNGTVGATTASTGAFTTLTSNGATTFTAGTASTSTTTGTTVITGGLGVSGRINAANFDGIVGANTAAAGSFTTINASTSITNAALTSGRVTFAGASGLLSDSANLVWNNSSVFLGIGETSPTCRLSIKGNNAPARGQITIDSTDTAQYSFYNGATEYFSQYTDVSGSNSGTTYANYTAAPFAWRINGAETMRITSAGDVGIGTSSPATKLNIENAGACQLQMAYSSTIFGRVGRLSSGNYEFSSYENGGSLTFGTTTSNGSTTERMRIDSSGNLLVGTTTQRNAAKFTLSYNGSTNNGLAIIETATASGTEFLTFVNPAGTNIGSVSRVGVTDAVIYNTTSDQRLKSNIADANPVLEKLMTVKVRQFDWTEGNLHQDAGFIAQELEPVLSGIVTKGKTEDDMWQMDYARLTPYLVKAIQEQQALIELLTTRLTNLENK